MQITRNNVLAAQLHDVAFEDGSDCVVVSGTLDDPYTGTVVPMERGGPVTVDIDHVYPLSLAWDMGAASWPQDRRTEFANDVGVNLLASESSANRAKGDSGPGEWMPANSAFHCGYAVAYIDVARQYDLAVTRADEAALAGALDACQDAA